MAEAQSDHMMERIADKRRGTIVAVQHIKKLQEEQVSNTRLTSTIDGYFNGGSFKENGKAASSRFKVRAQQGTARYASQPQQVQFKNQREQHLFQSRQQPSQGQFNTARGGAPQQFSSDSDDTNSDGYQPFNQTRDDIKQAKFDSLAQHISKTDCNTQITKYREALSLNQRTEQNKAQLVDDFGGIGLRELMTTEKDLAKTRLDQQNSSRKKRSKHDQPVDEGSFARAALPKNIPPRGATAAASTRKPLQGAPVDQKDILTTLDMRDYELNANINIAQGFDDSLKYQTERSRLPISPPFGMRKQSTPLETHKQSSNQKAEQHMIQQHRRLFSSTNQSKSHVLLDPMSNRERSQFGPAEQDQRSVKFFKLKKNNLPKQQPFLQKMQSQNAKMRKNIINSQSHKALSPNKQPTHMQKVKSQLTVFKKKIDIDDEQNRLGPNNKVNLPQHNSLYFNTNQNSLLLKVQELREYQGNNHDEDSDSSTDGSYSFRSKIAQNEAAMRRPSPDLSRKTGVASKSNAVNKDAERLLRQKSMAPVKDWTSSVTRRIHVYKNGVEKSEKHYAREGVAKYIYNKFGVHLLTFNHQTRNEAIPMFGEHIRQTNAQVFDEDKNALLFRKNSAMRSHFIGLKRDLKKQGLPVPKALRGAEQEKFVRKRVLDDQGTNDDFMKSPRRSLSPTLERGMHQQSTQQAGFVNYGKPQQLQSHRSLARFNDYLDEEDSEVNLIQFLPARPVIDSNMDNLEWQKTAFKFSNLKALYAAKCQDLRIERDNNNQFEKFCAHIISKAKNRCLNLSNCYFKENSARVLARQFMMYNQRVASYDLSFNELGDSGCSVIAEALYRTSHIVHLNLDMNSIQWEGISFLSRALCDNNSLIDLSLSSGKSGGNNRNRVMERGAYELSEALRVNKYLLFLNLTGNAIGNEGLSYILPAIAESDTLMRLDLTSNEITSGPVRQLVLKEKQRQGLSRPLAFDSDFKSLAPFKQHSFSENDQAEKKRHRLQSAYLIMEFLCKVTSLQELVLKQNKIGDEGMQIIAQALSRKDCKVKNLNLTSTQITADSMNKIVHSMRKNTNINTLIIDRNNLNMLKDIKEIIAAGSTLKVFSAAHCHLMDGFGEKFADALKTNKGLIRFNLYGNEMTCRTLGKLAEALKEMKESQGSLQEMNLGKNCFKDEGGVKLGEALRHNGTIIKINLSDNNFKDETALSLNRNLPEKKMVEEINLSKNLINLRVLELVEATCSKIKDRKIHAELPNQMQAKQGYRKDKEENLKITEQREKNDELLDRYNDTNSRLRKEKERQELKYDQIITDLDKRQATFKRVEKVLEEQWQEVVQCYRTELEDGEMNQNHLQQETTKISDKVDEVEKELKAKTQKIQDVRTGQKMDLDGKKRQELSEIKNAEMAKKKQDRAQRELDQFKQTTGTTTRRSTIIDIGRNKSSRVGMSDQGESSVSNRRKTFSRKAAGGSNAGEKPGPTNVKSSGISSEQTSNYNPSKGSPARNAAQASLFKNSSSQREESEHSSRQTTSRLRKNDAQSSSTMGVKSSEAAAAYTKTKAPGKKSSAKKPSRQGSTKV